ncbi:hypothetical protein ACJJTC_012335 [Scirpophaga incertulas]
MSRNSKWRHRPINEDQISNLLMESDSDCGNFSPGSDDEYRPDCEQESDSSTSSSSYEEPAPGTLHSTEVVLDLLDGYLEKGHVLYADNFYNSVDLASHLGQKQTHLSLFGIATGLVVLSFLGPENKVTAIIILFTTLTLSGSSSAGYMVNSLDLSPNFAGVLLSFTNCIANFGSIGTPIVSSYILRNDPSDISRWRIVFLLTAAICVTTNTIYLIFTSSAKQKWNEPDFMDQNNADSRSVHRLSQLRSQTLLA